MENIFNRITRSFAETAMFQGLIHIRPSMYHRLLIVAVIVFIQADTTSSNQTTTQPGTTTQQTTATTTPTTSTPTTTTIITTPRGALAQTYHWSSNLHRNWYQARHWCQENFTDMVAVQTREENDYLNQIVSGPARYWIGIRKVNGVFTWVETGESVTTEAANWAPGEPNNLGGVEDCVEIFIKDQNPARSGKWNDLPCADVGLRRTICYRADTDSYNQTIPTTSATTPNTTTSTTTPPTTATNSTPTTNGTSPPTTTPPPKTEVLTNATGSRHVMVLRLGLSSKTPLTNEDIKIIVLTQLKEELVRQGIPADKVADIILKVTKVQDKK